VKTDFAAGDAPGSVAVGDFDADSDPDLAVAKQFSDNVSVLLGGAAGTFGAKTDFAAGDRPFSVAVGDFNADADPDLAVANADSDNVSVLLGGAGGSFGVKTDFAAGDGPVSVAVGDFNADSDPDLAVANALSDNVSVLLNTSMPAVTLSPTSLEFRSVTLNATSVPKDVLVSNTGDNRLRIDDVRVADANRRDFRIAADKCEDTMVRVGDGCAIDVVFRPTAAGARAANLRITDNAPGSPHTVPLSGTGAVPRCAGQPATIVVARGQEVRGTARRDVVVGTAKSDEIRLRGGNDVACALGGNDLVSGGGGGDNINGGNGRDRLRGGASRDILGGKAGADTLVGGPGNDRCPGGPGKDKTKSC
jgi:predicted NUDIX family NTP pyrophosphohydrolase